MQTVARLRIEPKRAGTPAKIAGVEMIPIATQNRIVKFQPRPIKAEEASWLQPFLAATAKRGTKLRVDGATVHLEL